MTLLRFIVYHIRILILYIRYKYNNHCKFNYTKETYSGDIRKLSLMLPTYLEDNIFFLINQSELTGHLLMLIRIGSWKFIETKTPFSC